MRIRLRRWWRRHPPAPVMVEQQQAGNPQPETPAWAEAPTRLYDTVDPVRPYVIRECDG